MSVSLREWIISPGQLNGQIGDNTVDACVRERIEVSERESKSNWRDGEIQMGAIFFLTMRAMGQSVAAKAGSRSVGHSAFLAAVAGERPRALHPVSPVAQAPQSRKRKSDTVKTAPIA